MEEERHLYEGLREEENRKKACVLVTTAPPLAPGSNAFPVDLQSFEKQEYELQILQKSAGQWHVTPL